MVPIFSGRSVSLAGELNMIKHWCTSWNSHGRDELSMLCWNLLWLARRIDQVTWPEQSSIREWLPATNAVIAATSVVIIAMRNYAGLAMTEAKAEGRVIPFWHAIDVRWNTVTDVWARASAIQCYVAKMNIAADNFAGLAMTLIKPTMCALPFWSATDVIGNAVADVWRRAMARACSVVIIAMQSYAGVAMTWA